MWKRLIGVFCVICLAFTFLYLRIGAIATDDFYVEAGKSQSSYTLTLTTRRGNILDTNEKPLVNETYKNIASILITQENASYVQEITGLSQEEMQEYLKQQKPFLHEVSVSESDDDNVIVFSVADRYQEDQIAPHIIGYLSGDSGVTGLEKAYNEKLSENTQTVEVTYTLDALGRAIPGMKPEVKITQSSREDLVLTIDRDIQEICESAGKSIEKGAIVVMEAATGKLRAVCSFPEYSTYSLTDDMQSEDAPMINRAFTPLAVGSTFKIAVVATALEEGISPSLCYDCTGAYTLGETVMHCHRRDGHGVLKMEDALINSCNPYFINLGLQLDRNHLLRMANDLSFGKQYELAPGLYTQAGYLPDSLSDGALANLSFGQGDLLATPVQLTQMISCIVNNGVTPIPTLIEGWKKEGGGYESLTETPLGITAMEPTTAYKLKSFLISCVDAPNQNAKPTLSGAGGKTATAQTGEYVDGEERLNGWFVGFTTAEDPQYAICVIVEDAESGNIDASPIFAEISDKISQLHKE
jgi:penicillin-binding protein 2